LRASLPRSDDKENSRPACAFSHGAISGNMALLGGEERMRRGVAVAMAAIVAASMNLQTRGALAQTPSDAALDAARSAFEALPEADRRAVQDALIWTGDYKGTVDGGFGRMTLGAMVAYARRAKLPTDGTLDAKARSQLIAAAARARAAVAFKLVAEPRSGVTIGMPTRLLTRRMDTPNGALFATPDRAATLELFGRPQADALQTLYAEATAASPGRRVTYKVLRADFFVVSGEANGRTFYTRVARGMVNGAALLRGYSLSYAAAARAAFDRYGIAIANAFEPFAAAPAQTAQPTPAPTAPPAPKPRLAGTVVAVAPGRVLAVLPARACAAAEVAGRKASVAAAQPQGGLALLDVPGLDAPPLAPTPTPSSSGEAVILQQTPRQGAAPASELIVAPGQFDSDGARLLAPAQPGSNGAAVFDRSGALIGLVGRKAQAPRLVAGVAPQASAPFIGVDAALAFLEGAGVPVRAGAAGGAPRTVAAIALRVRASILPLVCVD
jgi:hypothetical protein